MTIVFLGGKLCVEKWRADVLQPLLCCPVAVLLRRNHSQVKALHAWQGELEATAGAHSGRTKADRGSSRYSKYFGVLFFLLGEKCGSELPPWRHHKE